MPDSATRDLDHRGHEEGNGAGLRMSRVRRAVASRPPPLAGANGFGGQELASGMVMVAVSSAWSDPGRSPRFVA